MKKFLTGGLLALLPAIAVLALYHFLFSPRVDYWEASAPELLAERIEKNTNITEVEFTCRIDAPTDKVFLALREPERLQALSEGVRFSRLVQAQDNYRVIEVEAPILGRPQHFTLRFAFFPKEKRIAFKTLEGRLADMQGEYYLFPSPDGKKTLLTYKATVQDRLSLPLPLSLQKKAIRQAFVAFLRALKKELAL